VKVFGVSISKLLNRFRGRIYDKINLLPIVIKYLKFTTHLMHKLSVNVVFVIIVRF